jgi:hypothetical protein
MRSTISICAFVSALAVGAQAVGQEKDKDKKIPATVQVILLVEAKAKDSDADKIKQIEFSKESPGRRTIKDSRVLDKNAPRLNGIYVVKEGTVTLDSGKVLEKQQVLIAVEVGKQTLKNVTYVEMCEGQSDKGPGIWHVYKADAVLPEKVKR